MILKLLLEVWEVLPKNNVCERLWSVQSSGILSRLHSAEDSASFINKKGTAEKQMSRALNIMTTVQ